MRANGGGTVCQHEDGRWEAVGSFLAPGDIRKRVRVHGTTRKGALAKVTEKIATSNCGVPLPSARGSLAAYLTYWLENAATHQLRTACRCCPRDLDSARDQPVCCAAGKCCSRRLWSLPQATG